MTEQSAAPNTGNKNHKTTQTSTTHTFQLKWATIIVILQCMLPMRFQVVMFLSVLLIDLVKTLQTSGEDD